MPTPLKLYISGVIAAGGLVLVSALSQWALPDPGRFLVYFVLAMLASLLKMRLPGITGTYSLNFLFILAGIAYFTLPETIVTGCGAALVQSLLNAKQRPTLVQALFNMANLAVSIGLCFLVASGPLAMGMTLYPPAVLALVACLFFAVNTLLVSGVLSLLQRKSLREVTEQWYFWSFPYYLVGAALVGLLPLSGPSPKPESWLLLLPLLYLLHFYYGLSRAPGPAADLPSPQGVFGGMALRAQTYIHGVVIAGCLLLTWSAFHWQSQQIARFWAYLLIAILVSVCKVRLPRMTGTISVNFVVLLAAIATLNLSEVLVISAVSAVVQCLWKPSQRPHPIQVFFSLAAMVLSSGLAYTACRVPLLSQSSESLISLLVVAAAFLYGGNTLLVSIALCLVERRPFYETWQQCYFWSFPYYLVGAAFAGLMIETSHSASWLLSLLVLPLMALVYLSYRLHVGRAAPADPPISDTPEPA